MSTAVAARPFEQPDSFEFTPANLERAKAHIAKYPPGRQASAVLPLLWIAQGQCILRRVLGRARLRGGFCATPGQRHVGLAGQTGRRTVHGPARSHVAGQLQGPPGTAAPQFGVLREGDRRDILALAGRGGAVSCDDRTRRHQRHGEQRQGTEPDQETDANWNSTRLDLHA